MRAISGRRWRDGIPSAERQPNCPFRFIVADGSPINKAINLEAAVTPRPQRTAKGRDARAAGTTLPVMSANKSRRVKINARARGGSFEARASSATGIIWPSWAALAVRRVCLLGIITIISSTNFEEQDALLAQEITAASENDYNI
ncbi:hypothetical protein MRX96_007117 [Rhipicephalus microplus]